jgi:PE-PPE domain-containing protein
VADLEAAMAAHGNDDLVIYGYSQGAVVAIAEKRKLAEQYPAGTTAPDIDFVLGGDGNLPNGGLFARFPGLYVPILDLSFNGPEPTDTQFDTVVITRQYDAFADFPLYPINLLADVNALLGFFYGHLYAFDVSLAPDPSTSTPFRDTHGDTTYYFFETQDLPLFSPLRSLGVPESLIDVVEPFFRVLVDLGYDRRIPPWEPTPARLIPTFDPGKVATDLVNAIGEGFNNALALFGLPPLLSIPAAPDTGSTRADVADDMDGTVEQNPADDLVEGTVERNPADKLNGNVERNAAENLNGNPADDIDRNQQTTLTGTQQTTSTGQSNKTTKQTAFTRTSSGTRQTVRGDADRPSTHSAADGSPVQHAAPSADGRRVHRGAADAPHRAAGLQGTDTA